MEISFKIRLNPKLKALFGFEFMMSGYPWKANGNSEGVGGVESQTFKTNVWGLT